MTTLRQPSGCGFISLFGVPDDVSSELAQRLMLHFSMKRVERLGEDNIRPAQRGTLYLLGKHRPPGGFTWSEQVHWHELDPLLLAEAPQIDQTTLHSSAASTRQVGGDHYKTAGVQPWDVIDTWPREQRIGAYRAGALKYLMRMGSKDENAQEIAKGQHYMEKLLEVLREGQP